MNELLHDAPIPLYYRLFSQLKEQILSGHLPVGSMLPTETKLLKQYNVSRQTVRRAKAKLEEEGLIATIQGSGSRVVSDFDWGLKQDPIGKIEDLVLVGQESLFDLQEFKMVKNSSRFIEKLKNPDERFIYKIFGLRYWKKQPLSYNVYHLPYKFGSRIQIDHLSEKPFIPQFEKILGFQIIEGKQSIYPGRANRLAANKLNIQSGMLVLSVDTLYINEDYIPVFFIKTIYRPGYKHEIRIRRGGAA